MALDLFKAWKPFRFGILQGSVYLMQVHVAESVVKDLLQNDGQGGPFVERKRVEAGFA
jgi:hypothetical protein